MDQRIGELKADGVNIETISYDRYYQDVTQTNPDMVFAMELSWSSFKEHVRVKIESGPVTVSVDASSRIFVLLWNQTTHYYYQLSY